MTIYYGGEDDVTRYIARKLANDISREMKIEDVFTQDVGIRERGAAIKNKLQQIVRLGKKNPVVFVFDSDGDCVVDILKQACPDGWADSFCALNIAIDEGESWLLADKIGFAKYFGVNIEDIDFAQEVGEVTYPYKTSLYIMRNIISKSTKKEIKENMSCTEKGKKPATYNMFWKEYIDNVWNMNEAKRFSNSLLRAIKRVENRFFMYCQRT